jgi:hypothetical protein
MTGLGSKRTDQTSENELLNIAFRLYNSIPAGQGKKMKEIFIDLKGQALCLVHVSTLNLRHRFYGFHFIREDMKLREVRSFAQDHMNFQKLAAKPKSFHAVQENMIWVIPNCLKIAQLQSLLPSLSVCYPP